MYVYTFQGAATTLAVKWADPDLQSKKKKAVEEANSDKRTVGMHLRSCSQCLSNTLEGNCIHCCNCCRHNGFNSMKFENNISQHDWESFIAPC